MKVNMFDDTQYNRLAQRAYFKFIHNLFNTLFINLLNEKAQ